MTAYGNAQQDAWVFFVDKENIAASLDNPISILSQEALDRKELHGVAIHEGWAWRFYIPMELQG